MYICICNAVTLRQVEECARTGADSIDALTRELGVGAGCGRCRECAEDVLRGCCKDANREAPALAAAA
jgi:bacterioferritin-associated ferredoxin